MALERVPAELLLSCEIEGLRSRPCAIWPATRRLRPWSFWPWSLRAWAFRPGTFWPGPFRFGTRSGTASAGRGSSAFVRPVRRSRGRAIAGSARIAAARRLVAGSRLRLRVLHRLLGDLGRLCADALDRAARPEYQRHQREDTARAALGALLRRELAPGHDLLAGGALVDPGHAGRVHHREPHALPERQVP